MMARANGWKPSILGQAPEMGKAQFLERLEREWERVCQSYPQARRVGLSDGARDDEPWLAARTTWQILDFYHASGYLAGAAPGLARRPSRAGRLAGGRLPRAQARKRRRPAPGR